MYQISRKQMYVDKCISIRKKPTGSNELSSNLASTMSLTYTYLNWNKLSFQCFPFQRTDAILSAKQAGVTMLAVQMCENGSVGHDRVEGAHMHTKLAENNCPHPLIPLLHPLSNKLYNATMKQNETAQGVRASHRATADSLMKNWTPEI